jgi:amino acid adenylation domain-containing protein/non-ribosomal peptide synthase protein (TIGR01720 family)
MSTAKADVENIYPVTPMQEGMLFHALLEPGSNAYFEQLSWRIHGDLDIKAFEASWNKLIERHAILRTLFVHEGTDRPLQVVLRSRPITLREIDLRGPDAEAGVAAYTAADRTQPFVLNRDPLLRVAVLRLPGSRFEIVWSHHHIVLDGWSLGLALTELIDIYRAIRERRAPELPAVPPFSHFVKWLQARDHDAAMQFWTLRMSECSQRITVPHTRGGRTSAGARRGSLSFGLGAAATGGLQALAARRGVTLAVVLHAIWALLLGRYADAADVVFGSVVSGRPPDIPNVGSMIGNLINTIPVRVRLDRAVTFDDLIAAMQREAAEAEPHQHVALNRIQSAHRLEDGLFGTLVSFANYPTDPRLVAGLSELGFVVDSVSHIEQTHYDLDVQFVPAPELQVRITYATRFYDPRQIEAIEGHFRAVVAAVILRSDLRFDDIDLLSGDEREGLLGDRHDVQATVPKDTLVAAFERQVTRTPGHIAVIASDGQLTYAELNARANQLAHRLRSVAPMVPDSTVAILLARGVEMAVGILAVLKSGAGYVPLEPGLPRERIAYIIVNAQCKAVVASSATIAAARGCAQVPVVGIDDARADPVANVNAGIGPSDLAYVIYTSGSTGRPKGVMIEHHSVINLVDGLRSHVYDRYEGNLRVALLASYSFDASVQQIFAALLLGHTLVIVDEATKKDGAALNRLLVQNRLDIIDGTPTMLQIMARSSGFDDVRRSVRHALIGGEPLPWRLAEDVMGPGLMVVSNVYGPTECCVDATAQLLTAEMAREGLAVPVGRPLPNTQVLVVGRTGHLAPRGARGEICIAGRGVGRGYASDEALTARKFVRLASLGALRVFRTADAGRILADGAVDCLGRLDDQVKVRGFRIEVGELEHQLSAYPGVERAAVFVAGDELHATLVLSASMNVDELRAHLGETLPEYMIPSQFFRAAALPRTASGKLDRKRLAAGGADTPLELGSDYAAPGTDVERILAKIWQSALGVSRIGIDDNYFALGGDSIKALQILSQLLRHNLRMEIRDLFLHRTIHSLAPLLLPVARATAEENGSSVGPPMLSAVQARFFSEHGAEPGHFHHALLLEARDPLDPVVVGAAFAAVRDRHEALRFAFAPEPEVMPAGAPPPLVQVVPDLASAQAEFLAPFALATGPLHRIAIVRSNHRDLLLIVVHHLCIDGVSWRILIEELATELSAVKSGEVPDLPPLTDPPLKVARKLADYGCGPAARSQLNYWSDVEARCAPLVDSGSAPPGRYGDRTTLSVTLDGPATSALLVDANRAYTTATEDLMLAALAGAIHARFGRTATGVLLESHGRHPLVPGMDMSRTIGWFTSLYPFVLAFDPAHDLGLRVKSMKEAIRSVPDQGTAYGLLRYIGGAPLRSRPQVSFNYLGQLDGHTAAPLRISPESIEGGVSPDAFTLAEIEVSALAVGGRMRLMLAFNAKRFAPPAMQDLLEAWQTELREIVQHCKQRVHTELTPADLSYTKITVEELEDIFK